MSDESFRFAISPIVTERNARRLVDIMAQCFPQSGGICEELRRKFEEITGLKRQSFYDTLAYCKYRQWVVGGGSPRNPNRLYTLNPDGSWRPPISTGEPAGEPPSRDQLEYLADSRAKQVEELQDEVDRLRDWSSGTNNDEANIALGSLIKIVSDNTASPRQRIRASAAVLGYRVRDDSAVEFVKRFLQSLCVNTDIAIDHRIEASELLRKHEAPRVMSETVRPSYRDDAPVGVIEPLADLVKRRRERQDRLEREAIESAMEYMRPDGCNGDSSDEH